MVTDSKLTFPWVVTLKEDSWDPIAWAKDQKASLLERVKESGAILFRGFPLHSAADFYHFVQALQVPPLPYVGGAAPRKTVYKDVHTTNESPPDQPIPFHHEMAQVPVYPECLFFFCDIPAEQGGETPILQSHLIYEFAASQFPEFINDLRKWGVVYTRIIPKEDDPSSPIGRGWVNTFHTSDPKEAEKAAQELNVQFEWLENGDLKTMSPALPAIKEYQGKYVWFNSILAAYKGWKDSRNDPKKAVTLGNGQLLDPVIMDRLLDFMQESSVAFIWEKGDLLWIDNHQVMHSRCFLWF